jgi:hypothetical protein
MSHYIGYADLLDFVRAHKDPAEPIFFSWMEESKFVNEYSELRSHYILLQDIQGDRVHYWRFFFDTFRQTGDDEQEKRERINARMREIILDRIIDLEQVRVPVEVAQIAFPRDLEWYNGSTSLLDLREIRYLALDGE